MAVKIRLARHGAKKNPYYRIVIADSRSPRDGRIVDEIGRYDPNQNPSMIKIDLAAADEWIAKGAQPTDTVVRLLETARKTALEPVAKPAVKAEPAAAAEDAQ